MDKKEAFVVWEKELETAAEWWAEAIVDPKMDNGDKSLSTMTYFSLFKTTLEELSDSQLNIFKESLKDLLLEDLLKYGSTVLSVDYQPVHILRLAGERAFIKEDHFPIKTDMRVSSGYVVVRHGYGSAPEVLYEDVNHWEEELKLAQRRAYQYEKDLLSDPGDPMYIRWLKTEKEKIKEIKEKLSSLGKEV